MSLDVVTKGFGVELLVDYLLDDKGRNVLVGGLDAQAVFRGMYSVMGMRDGALLYMFGGFNARAGRTLKFMLEVILPAVYHAEIHEFQMVALGLMFNYGLRFHGPSIAVDICFVRPLHPDTYMDKFVMGFPLVNFTARF